jgi:hypothetical protein
MEVIVFALILVGLILGIVELAQSQGRSLLAWAVVLIAAALLLPRLTAL